LLQIWWWSSTFTYEFEAHSILLYFFTHYSPINEYITTTFLCGYIFYVVVYREHTLVKCNRPALVGIWIWLSGTQMHAIWRNFGGPKCYIFDNLIYKFTKSVGDWAFCLHFLQQNRPGQSDGRTDRFSMAELARTDGLCIISTNAHWSVS